MKVETDHLEVMEKASEQIAEHLKSVGIDRIVVIGMHNDPKLSHVSMATEGFEFFKDIENALCGAIAINRMQWSEEEEEEVTNGT